MNECGRPGFMCEPVCLVLHLYVRKIEKSHSFNEFIIIHHDVIMHIIENSLIMHECTLDHNIVLEGCIILNFPHFTVFRGLYDLYQYEMWVYLVQYVEIKGDLAKIMYFFD